MEKVYLNNTATTYPKPNDVITSLENYFTNPPFHASRAGLEISDCMIIDDCRLRLARLLNVKNKNQIVFTSGSTESLNLALWGLGLDNAHIITTTTEHNSVLRPLKTMEKNGKITLSIVDCDKNGFVNPSDFENEINSKTKAIVINHASNVTGIVQDIESISFLAKKNNLLFVLDASQSLGNIKTDLQAINVDLLALTGHKYLYGIQGIGALYIKEGLNLKPLKVGGTGIKSEYLYQPEEMPLLFEAGTPNIPGIVSLNAGLKYLEEEGINNIVKKKSELIETLWDKFLKIPGIITYGIYHKESVPIFNFNVKNMETEDVGYILEQSFGIIIRSGLHCSPLIHKAIGSFPYGTIRVSPSHFNTSEDIDRLVDAVEQISNMV